MRIWILTVGEPVPRLDAGNPRLLRSGLLARLMTERGHEVTWWTSAFDHYGKRHRSDGDSRVDWEGGRIELLHASGYRRNVSLQRFVEHEMVARKFARRARAEPRPDVILASLPTVELAHAAVAFGRETGTPVLVDVRDLWPDVLVDILPRPLRPLGRAVLFRMVRQARQALAGCQGVVGISRGYLDWGLALAGRPEAPGDAMVPLGYIAPETRAGDDAEAGRKLLAMGIDPAKPIVWYVGSFGRQYDLSPVIAAAHGLHRDRPGALQVVISGDGEAGPGWRREAEGAPNVIFTGWIDGDAINWLRARAAIGLQPYAAGAPQGLANKLFEYLSAGIPVLSSLEGENEALIAQHRCGLSYRAGDAEALRRHIEWMLDHPQQRAAMGRDGQRLFEQQFDGRFVLARLADHLEAAAARAAGGRSAPP